MKSSVLSSKKLSRKEKERKIRAIVREFEDKKRALGLKAPLIRRGPIFYLVVILGLCMIGAAVLQNTDKTIERKTRLARHTMAGKSVDALAEALGRFRFHCGVYPQIADGGLEALARKSSAYRGWIGPYTSKIVLDPWKRAYIYEPPSGTNEFPVVLSLGPDGIRDTVDDVTPNPALFMKPFRDTTWTNDWAPFWERGIIVREKKDVPHK